MNFQLHVFDAAGSVRILHIDGDSEASATAQARAQGYRVVQVRANRRLALSSGGTRWNRRSLDVDLFAQECAALLEAGVGVVDALKTLKSTQKRDATARIYGQLLRALEEGASLSSALEKSDYPFPPVLIACVKASEQTGDLANSLKRYSVNSQALQALRTKVVSASIYPVVLLLAGALVIAFLLGFVVPRFANLLEHNGHDLPLLSQWLMGWGQAVHAHGSLIVASAIAAAVAAAIVLRQPASRAFIADRVLSAPGIGPHIRVYRQAQFFRTSAMLVDGGIPALASFSLAARLIGRQDEGGLRQAMQDIQRGSRISDAFERHGIADGVAHRLLTVAEKTGELGVVLEKVGTYQETQVARAIDWFSRLVEPLMMIVIGLVIGGIVVLMYMPIFELASSIQ